MYLVCCLTKTAQWLYFAFMNNAKYKKVQNINSATTFAATVLNLYEEFWKVLQFKTTKFHLHQFEMVLKAARVPLGPPKAPNVFELREN